MRAVDEKMAELKVYLDDKKVKRLTEWDASYFCLYYYYYYFYLAYYSCCTVLHTLFHTFYLPLFHTFHRTFFHTFHHTLIDIYMHSHSITCATRSQTRD